VNFSRLMPSALWSTPTSVNPCPPVIVLARPCPSLPVCAPIRESLSPELFTGKELGDA